MPSTRERRTRVRAATAAVKWSASLDHRLLTLVKAKRAWRESAFPSDDTHYRDRWLVCRDILLALWPHKAPQEGKTQVWMVDAVSRGKVRVRRGKWEATDKFTSTVNNPISTRLRALKVRYDDTSKLPWVKDRWRSFADVPSKYRALFQAEHSYFFDMRNILHPRTSADHDMEAPQLEPHPELLAASAVPRTRSAISSRRQRLLDLQPMSSDTEESEHSRGSRGNATAGPIASRTRNSTGVVSRDQSQSEPDSNEDFKDVDLHSGDESESDASSSSSMTVNDDRRATKSESERDISSQISTPPRLLRGRQLFTPPSSPPARTRRRRSPSSSPSITSTDSDIESRAANPHVNNRADRIPSATSAAVGNATLAGPTSQVAPASAAAIAAITAPTIDPTARTRDHQLVAIGVPPRITAAQARTRAKAGAMQVLDAASSEELPFWWFKPEVAKRAFEEPSETGKRTLFNQRRLVLYRRGLRGLFCFDNQPDYVKEVAQVLEGVEVVLPVTKSVKGRARRSPRTLEKDWYMLAAVISRVGGRVRLSNDPPTGPVVSQALPEIYGSENSKTRGGDVAFEGYTQMSEIEFYGWLL